MCERGALGDGADAAGMSWKIGRLSEQASMERKVSGREVKWRGIFFYSLIDCILTSHMVIEAKVYPTYMQVLYTRYAAVPRVSFDGPFKQTQIRYTRVQAAHWANPERRFCFQALAVLVRRDVSAVVISVQILRR